MGTRRSGLGKRGELAHPEAWPAAQGSGRSGGWARGGPQDGAESLGESPFPWTDWTNRGCRFAMNSDWTSWLGGFGRTRVLPSESREGSELPRACGRSLRRVAPGPSFVRRGRLDSCWDPHPMPSLILPAHNEAALLKNHLSGWLEGLREEVEVIVACNGCEDDSVAIARAFEPRVQVLDLPEPSKVAALNAADRVARSFPRIYLDADVAIGGKHLNRVYAALEGGALAAEPMPLLDSGGASWPVRAYYRVWQALHGGQPGSVGSGLYGLSERGRARFEAFPRVIADDGYVRAHFGPGEIEWVTGAQSRVRTPRRLGDLIRIKTRSRLGNLELAQRFPELWAQKRASGGGLPGKARSLPLGLWPALVIYIPIQLWTRWRAKRFARDLAAYRWERDESSRIASPGADS